MPGPRRSRVAQANAFLAFALAYSLHVLPHARREIRWWREHARSVPDRRLRELALATQQDERGNLEGAAAFAVIAPRDRRAAVTRAAIAFQATYDFVDTVAEQPRPDPEAHAHRLHLVLLAALDERDRPAALSRPHGRRRRHGERLGVALGGDDGGYVAAMTDACRRSLRMLPCYALVRDACLRAAQRMVVYQSLVHADVDRRKALRSWAERLGAPPCELHWWETAAGAASSLSVFALIAAAARPGLRAWHVCALERAYFPLAGALHVLLDSLIDSAADERTGHHSLVSHYGSAARQGERLALLTRTARAQLRGLPLGRRHEAVLAAMVCFYLSSWEASAQASSAGAHAGVRRAILAETGPMAAPALALLRLRRALAESAPLAAQPSFQARASPRLTPRCGAPAATHAARGASRFATHPAGHSKVK